MLVFKVIEIISADDDDVKWSCTCCVYEDTE